MVARFPKNRLVTNCFRLNLTLLQDMLYRNVHIYVLALSYMLYVSINLQLNTILLLLLTTPMKGGFADGWTWKAIWLTWLVCLRKSKATEMPPHFTFSISFLQSFCSFLSQPNSQRNQVKKLVLFHLFTFLPFFGPLCFSTFLHHRRRTKNILGREKNLLSLGKREREKKQVVYVLCMT